MRYVGFVLLILLLRFAPWAAGQGHSEFAGTWRMDPARSESAHGETAVESATLVIELTDTGITMDTTRIDAGKPAAFHEKLNLRLDGSETTNNSSNAGASVRAKARWDGAKLVVETSREIKGSTVTTRYVHTLSANGQEMTIDMTLSVQHGYENVVEPRNSGHGTDVFVRVGR
jgi:hypothetical protein